MVGNAEAPVPPAPSTRDVRGHARRSKQQRILERCVKNVEWTTADVPKERLPELTKHTDVLRPPTLNPHAAPFVPAGVLLQAVPVAAASSTSAAAAAATTASAVAPAITSLGFAIAGHMIPHPAKAHKGGEDAYFISDDSLVFGIADGVGGWEALGVDSGLYSRSLMCFCGEAVNSHGLRNPFDVLKFAHDRSSCIQGSTTACVVSLDPVTSTLSAVNLGDSGFMIIREGRIHYRTKEQQHFFNCPYQIGSSRDQPEDAQRLTVEGMQEGDIVIACTDGVFDNLFAEDIARLVVESVHLGPQVLAKRIADMAHTVALGSGFTPFQDGAQKAGQYWKGGKLDDITVLAAIVTKS